MQYSESILVFVQWLETSLCIVKMPFLNYLNIMFCCCNSFTSMPCMNVLELNCELAI